MVLALSFLLLLQLLVTDAILLLPLLEVQFPVLELLPEFIVVLLLLLFRDAVPELFELLGLFRVILPILLVLLHPELEIGVEGLLGLVLLGFLVLLGHAK